MISWQLGTRRTARVRPRERPVRVVIMGAAGRDFHNFNIVYRDNPAYRVVAFTATQIPNIEGRMYPPELAGRCTRRHPHRARGGAGRAYPA